MDTNARLPLRLSISRHNARAQFPNSFTSPNPTILRREADGTITIVSLAAAWKAAASRETDGTITLAKA